MVATSGLSTGYMGDLLLRCTEKEIELPRLILPVAIQSDGTRRPGRVHSGFPTGTESFWPDFPLRAERANQAAGFAAYRAVRTTD